MPADGDLRAISHRVTAMPPIAHLGFDAFYASVERQRELRGLPVIVSGSGPLRPVYSRSSTSDGSRARCW